MTYEEVPLFDLDAAGAGQQPVAATPRVAMPKLPQQVTCRPYRAARGGRCDYCVLVHMQGDPVTGIRMAAWQRTGTDAAVLLLCTEHRDLLFKDSAEGESR